MALAELPKERISILALVPVRNRCATTLKFLEKLYQLRGLEQLDLDVLILDDGSTDGTADAIASEFPQVSVGQFDGSLYWSGAIMVGLQRFLKADHDFCWLLNDDIELHQDCLLNLLAVAKAHPKRMYSGVVLDDTGMMLYGGQIRRSHFRFRLAQFSDLQRAAEVDTVNGNCLLISRGILNEMTLPKPGTFIHEALDIYLGLEATRLAKPPIIVSSATAIGEPNTGKFAFYTNKLKFFERWKQVIGPKGVPPRAYWCLCRRYAGFLAPIYFLRPYLRAVFPK